MGKWLNFAAGLGIATLSISCLNNYSAPWDQEDQNALESVRGDLQSLTQVQTVLAWYSASQGEPSILSETYRNTNELLTSSTVSLVERAMLRSDIGDAEQRSLSYLRNHLATEILQQQSAVFDDQVHNAETSYSVQLSWLQDPVPFRELEAMLASENNDVRRQEIHGHITRFWARTINPILEEKEARARSLAERIGYGSYLDLSETYRGAKLKPLAKQARTFLEDTDVLYKELLAAEAKDTLNKDTSELRRADINLLASPPAFNDFFPSSLQMPAFEHLLSGIGLNLKTSAGTTIQIDDSAHPLKESRAMAYAIRVPDDIRVNLKPVGGMEDYSALFYEGARALHLGWTKTETWEYQYIGPQATSEGYGEFFNYVWSDPRWLVHYRTFVEGINSQDPALQIPVLSNADVGRLVRHRVFWDLYYLRRYAYARVVYEYFLHGGNPEEFKDIYDGPTDDLQELYRTLFSQAYGFELSKEEALRYRTDVDDFLLSLDYARSFLFAHGLHEAIRNKYGYDWYDNREVGRTLKRAWSDGTRLTPEEVLTSLGQDSLDFQAVTKRLRRLLLEAESLSPGSTTQDLKHLLEQN